ncbi:GNAT family N-acetyltransferase [Streptomyces profundus]|nr:GNAT family N-acetyltransferase [Streptomyces sp. MA3_2.13]
MPDGAYDSDLLSLAEVRGLASWTELCGPSDLFCTPRWLAVEQTGTGPWVPAANGCLVTGRNGRPIAGATLQSFDQGVDDDTCRVDLMVRALPQSRGLSDAALADGLLPSLTCGGWFNSTVMIAPGASDGEAAAARRALLTRAVDVGRAWACASICLPYVDASDSALRQLLREDGYLELPAPDRHVLSCDHPNLESYLASLPSRRRVRRRKELRICREAGVTTERLPLDDSTVERVGVLAHNLERKYGQSSSARQLTEWFAAIATHLTASVFTASLNGEVVAMTLWLHHADRLYGFHAGFDYRVGRGLPLYSLVGYHLPVAYGLATPGIRVLEYGISADEAKRLRGTAALPQLLCLKPLTPAARECVERLADAARPAVLVP